MSSIGSLTGSSSSSSIYGNRTNNMITGLMSGMDTESMIEGLVQSYQQKIQGLQQDRTVLQWQQNAYQSISDKLVEFSRKYMSYTSNTNLLSSSFFTNAVTTTTGGKYADLVTATGKSSSTILLNSVSQLATTARYTSSGKGLDSSISFDKKNQLITANGSEFDLNDTYSTSNMDGSLSITYGAQKITIEFGKEDVFTAEDGSFDPEKLKTTIEEKLKDQTIKVGNSTVPASERIEIEVDANGRIAFSDKSDAGNNVYLSGASGNLKDFIKEYDTTIKDKNGVVLLDVSKDLTTTVDNLEYLSGKTLTVTLDGKTKTITMPTYKAPQDEDKDDPSKIQEAQKSWIADLQKEFDNAFGSGKITISHNQFDTDSTDKKISFTVADSSTLSVTSSDSVTREIMGLGDSGVTSYLNTQKTLGELLGKDGDPEGTLAGLTGKKIEVDSEKVTEKKDKDGNTVMGEDGKPILVDDEGNVVKADSDGKYYRVDDDGEFIYEYDLTINGTTIGPFTKDTELGAVLTAINNSEAGVNVSFSKLTGEFVFTAKDSGSGGRVEIGNDLGGVLFGPGMDGPSMKELGWVVNNGVKRTLSFTLNDDKNTPIVIDNITNDTSLAEVENRIREKLEGTGISMSRTDSGYVFTDANGKQLTPTSTADSENIYLTNRFIKYDIPDNYTMPTFEAGQDAKMSVTINGKEMELTRSSNSFEIDGMTITVNGTFNVGDAEGAKNDPVTFTSKSDTDTIVDAIKTMVNDYNAIMSEIKKAYSDMPLTKSDGSKYEPLTDADMEDMSDSAIESYEEKAKTGILFMDRDLSALYGELRNVISSGSNAAALRSIGIDTEYSDGLTTLTLDETALRQALEEDPDKVQNVFTQSKEYGAATDGLMTTLQNITDKYAATTGATKGILIEKAGSKYSPTSALQNDLLDQMNDIDDEISTWQDKMSDKVDYYTNKFTQLEMLINEMNSQSSALSGLLGG